MKFLELLWLKIAVMKRNTFEYVKVVWRYYGDRNFRKWDLALLWSYFLRNPFRICHNYLKKIGFEDPYLYGETPLTSLQMIVEQSAIQKEDHLFELGCGRGRGCLWLNAFIGCKVTGIELVPTFVEKANRVKNRFKIKEVEFRQGDIAKANYEGATVLYLYGTCFDDAFIEQLIDKFRELPTGTKIITVSYSLSEYEYAHSALFETINVFPVKFTWGEADVYVQVKTK